MLPVVILLVGAAITGYCLWLLRRWIAELEAKVTVGPRRLEALVEELVATAEATSAVVAEKTEALADSLAKADEQIARLQDAVSAARAAAGIPRPVAVPNTSPGRRTMRGTKVKRQSSLGPVPLSSAPQPAAMAAQPFQGAERPPMDLHGRVTHLLDSGADVTTVARTLNITKGEVMLIQGLRKIR